VWAIPRTSRIEGDTLTQCSALCRALAAGYASSLALKLPKGVQHGLGAIPVAKIEWHPGELYPRVGFIVTNLARPTERVVAFYNQRGTAEQWIKEGRSAIKWTRTVLPDLLRQRRAPSAPRPRVQPRQLHADAGDAQDGATVVADQPARNLIKNGAKAVSHGRYVTFQMAEVAVSRQMFADILSLVARLRALPASA
jgi:hypothetical protein